MYDEMTIIEFVQGIVDSGSLVEQENTYLSYTPIAGSDRLYLARLTHNKEVEKPVYNVHVEQEQNRVHYLPYTFAEKQEELFFTMPELKTQLDIDYFTR